MHIHHDHLDTASKKKKKVRKLGHGEAYGENKANTRKSMHACIVEAHESMRKRLEITPPEDHEDRIAGKGSFPRVIAIFCKSSFLWTEQ